MSTTRRGPHHAGERPGQPRAGAEPQTAAPKPDLTPELEARVAELAAALDESRDQHIRLAADFDNFRKRSRQERLDVIQHASQGLIEALLPVLDDLHRALEHAPKSTDSSWLKGIGLSVQKLEEVLGAQGVQPIESIGEHFDPNLHEAVGTEDSDEPEDTVVQELRRGYRLHDRVLRPSLVKLARSRVEA